MKIFTAVMLTETSDVTPISTTEKDWLIEAPDKSMDENKTLFFSIQKKVSAMAKERGWSVAESIVATAMPPGGRTTRSTYEAIRSTILSDLKNAMPVDGIFLQLHGAMMAHGYDDCEGDLLRHIRELVGDTLPIGIELDPHCHVSQGMMKDANIIVLYKTWLHTDIEERAVELFDLLAKTLEKKIKPTMALFDCHMIDMYDEAYEPMKSFMATVYQREQEPGILSISPVHGFPLADVPDMGSKMLVITDDNQQLANKTAEELGYAFYEVKGQQFGEDKKGESQYLSIAPALEKTKGLIAAGKTPVKLIEWGDLGGCGFPTDGTELVSALLKEGISNLAIGLMCDPLAVANCVDAGVGAELMLRIGGKASPLSGVPLDLRVTVTNVINAARIQTWLGDVELGDLAVVSNAQTDFILTSKRAVGYDLDNFKELGVDPALKDCLICKYLRDDEAINVLGANFNPVNWGFRRISRPKWPWDSNTLDSIRGQHV